VAIVSGQLTQTEKVFGDLLGAFSDGPVVIGPTAPMLTAAYHSASEAISGMNAVAGWRGAPLSGSGSGSAAGRPRSSRRKYSSAPPTRSSGCSASSRAAP